MCPGKRLPILFAFLLPLLIFYLHQPPILPTAPCEPLKPLSRLQDLAEVWRQSEQICGEIGASLRTLYQVEQEEAGRLVLPKPLLEGGLKYDYTKIGSQLSSPHAESARAVTGRRCPHSGEGEDFLTGQLNFFTETAVTPEQKVEKSFPRWEFNRHAEG